MSRKFYLVVVLGALLATLTTTVLAQGGTPLTPEQRTQLHVERLVQYDPVFRQTGSALDWLKASGDISWAANQIEARQVEEEARVVNGETRILVSGVQVRVTNLNVKWPACFTTDATNVPVGSETRAYQPDQRNPSRLWTNVTGFTGTATVYLSCWEWAQIDPGTVVATPMGPISTLAVVATNTPVIIPPTQTPVVVVVTATALPLPATSTSTSVPPVPSVPTATVMPSVPTATPSTGGGPTTPPTPFPWGWVLGVLGALLLLALVVAGIVLLVRRLRTTPPPPPLVALNITTAAMLPNAPVGPGWVQALAAAGGTAPYRNWRLGVGRPAWLNIDTNTGQLSGTTVAGDFLFQVSVDDSAAPAHSVTKAFQLHVA